MGDFIYLVGPNHTLQVFGVRLVGANAENGTKLLLTAVFILFVIVAAWRCAEWPACCCHDGETSRLHFGRGR